MPQWNGREIEKCCVCGKLYCEMFTVGDQWYCIDHMEEKAQAMHRTLQALRDAAKCAKEELEEDIIADEEADDENL